jgi:hypothetical protein
LTVLVVPDRRSGVEIELMNVHPTLQFAPSHGRGSRIGREEAKDRAR